MPISTTDKITKVIVDGVEVPIEIPDPGNLNLILRKTFSIESDINNAQAFHSVDLQALYDTLVSKGEGGYVYSIRREQSPVSTEPEVFYSSSEQFRAKVEGGKMYVWYVSYYHKWDTTTQTMEVSNKGFVIGTVTSQKAWKEISISENNVESNISTLIKSGEYTISVYKMGPKEDTA